MAYLVLARKYRPQTFAEVIEQKQTTQTLMNAISTGRVAHAILFSGPRGTGKTTIARILAKAMNCEQGPTPVPCNQCRSCKEITAGNSADVYEIDGASNNSVDQIRELRGNIKFMPAHSPYKIYIIDEVHMLTQSAFNALLKTLEEPPPHVMFEFATTEPHKIPVTILSRCQRYDLSYVSLSSIVGHLARLCAEEGYEIENRSLELIAREAGGSIRDALSLLDQIMSCTDTRLTHDHVIDILGITNRESLFSLSGAAICGDLPRILDLVDSMYRSGMDIKKIYSELISHFRDLLIVKLGKNMETSAAIPSHEIDLIKKQIKDTTEIHLHQILSILLNDEKTIRYSSQPKIALEMALIKVGRLQPVLPVDTLIEKIEALKDRFQELESRHGNAMGTSDAAPSATGNQPQERISGNPYLKRTGPTAEDTYPPDTNAADPGKTEKIAAEQQAGEKIRSAAQDMDLAEAWEAILAIIDDKHPLLAANLRNSTLSMMHDNKLEVDVYGSKINLDILAQEKNLKTLKTICSTFYGKEMAVRLNHKIKPEEIKRDQRPRQQPGIHPLVIDALEIFGGDIINSRT